MNRTLKVGQKNKQLDKEDLQRSNLNSKYLSLTLVLNILILLSVFFLCVCVCLILIQYNLIFWDIKPK